MSAKRKTARFPWWLTALLAVLPSPLLAQEPTAPQQLPAEVKTNTSPDQAAKSADAGAFNQVLQAGCATCGNGLVGGGNYQPPGGDCDNCFCGQKKCVPCEGQNCVSRMFCAFYDCVCCPDPCYEGRWVAGANAAFFVDGARPVTQMMLRWDSVHNMTTPDRGEFFWPQEKIRGPANTKEFGLNYNALTLYNEAAIEKFSFFTQIPYLNIDPTVNLGAGGFGDIKIGTKTLLLDCELMQTTFEFVTSIPSGNFRKGLGTGHVSLAPGLLTAIKLCTDTYLQTQITEWIPIGGDANFSSAVLQYNASFNHVICRPVGDTQLIGTLEFDGYTFQSGKFTDPTGKLQPATGSTYFNIGPGLRFVVCNTIDIGVAATFAVSEAHYADQFYRMEFRWRF